MVINKVTSVALQFACLSIGDVVESAFRPEYLKWRDVELFCKDVPDPTVEDLRLSVTLRSKTRNIDPQDDDAYVIALLLVQALRHGRVHAASIEEIIRSTKSASLKWTHPDAPVC